MAESINRGSSSRKCRRCGSAVSRSFVRVFGVENTVYGCIDCLSRKRLSNGEAAKRPEEVKTEDENADSETSWDSVLR